MCSVLVILVFEPKRRYTIPKENTSAEALNKRWLRKKLQFSANIYLQRVKDKLIVTVER